MLSLSPDPAAVLQEYLQLTLHLGAILTPNILPSGACSLGCYPCCHIQSVPTSGGDGMTERPHHQ